MGFSRKVAEEALVAAERCCCLCHRFCGSKIEVHHIVQEADGGDDSFENAIPLCFDCHAEVGHYNVDHPKGRKFTTSELRQHRDRWYDKVRSSPASLSEPSTVDKQLAVWLYQELNLSGAHEFLRDHSFGGPFRPSQMDPWWDVRRALGKPEFEFEDAELEKSRAVFRERLCTFVENLSRYTGPLQTSQQLFGFDSVFKGQEPKLFRCQYRKLDQLATEVSETFDDLIRLARRRLGLGVVDLGAASLFSSRQTDGSLD